uniref:Uncharacterized protein n=1 Tax=Globodera rostochiensis TaxID=31243 RepID=A0A914HZJ9_GLORO
MEQHQQRAAKKQRFRVAGECFPCPKGPPGILFVVTNFPYTRGGPPGEDGLCRGLTTGHIVSTNHPEADYLIRQ